MTATLFELLATFAGVAMPPSSRRRNTESIVPLKASRRRESMVRNVRMKASRRQRNIVANMGAEASEQRAESDKRTKWARFDRFRNTTPQEECGAPGV